MNKNDSILKLAIKVLEDKEIAEQWLRTPQRGLGGATPLSFLKTKLGRQEVRSLLKRIEYGVYS